MSTWNDLDDDTLPKPISDMPYKTVTVVAATLYSLEQLTCTCRAPLTPYRERMCLRCVFSRLQRIAGQVGDWTEELFRLCLEDPHMPLWITAAQPSVLEQTIYYDNGESRSLSTRCE